MNKTMTMLVWERCPSKFHGTDLVVLLKLAGESSADARCYLHVDVLAAACGIKPRALQYRTSDLEKSGVLHVEERKGTSNCYTLNREAIRRLPRVKCKSVGEGVQQRAPLDPFGTSPEIRM
jgi:hypothetical protein